MKELQKPITEEEIQYALTKKIGKKSLHYDDNKNLGRLIAYSDSQGIDFKEKLFNYEKHLNSVEGINEFVKSLNFQNNIMVDKLKFD